jgi:hypothetical protein
MGLKDLFGKTSEKVVTKQQLETLYNEAESQGYLEEVQEDRERFLPAVDFTSASNFARYGSAERYYVDAIKNIYENYPYDGSKKEKQEWRNKASQLDLYIYDEIYPRTTGYVNLSSSASLTSSFGYRSSSSPQYVAVKGGPNKSSTDKFETANIYDLDKNRESNLGIVEQGNTVEFWFKDNLNTLNGNYNSGYALFDMWNGVAVTGSEYARLAVTKVSGSNKFSVTYRSGSAGVTNALLDYTFDSTDWHHYAFSFANSNNDLDVRLYVDGNLVTNSVIASSGGIGLAYNLNSVAHIGALRASVDAASASYSGLGTSCGSFDEFRFWKVARNSQQIYRNWFTSIGGGANTDDSNNNLGLYLKFNEGVVSDSTENDLDKICLDYSGRVSNGTIVNYTVACKSTGSAIDDYYGLETEEKDPIIFSTNPLVADVIATYTELGQQHDINNSTSIYTSLPGWITDEAQKLDAADLSQLVQIIASYFDTLHLQIKDLPSLKNISYDSSTKPKPFAKYLLSSSGFENLDIFNDTSFIEEMLSRNEESEFSEKLHNIKNTIYQNIYNNLSYIYKTKGTEKSLRNLIRCFGVDDELIKINMYANNATYDVETKYTYSSIAKKFIDFNDPDRYDGYVYQKSKAGNADTKNYIPAITQSFGGKFVADYVPITLQAEVIFPKKPIIESENNESSDFISSSLFGMYPVIESGSNIVSWDTGLKISTFAIKPQAGSKDAHFTLNADISGYTVNLESDTYRDVYENEKWNLAVRLKPSKYSHTNLASGSHTGDYLLEFVGINSSGDATDEMFVLSATIPQANATAALRKNKNVFAGALHNDYDSAQLLTRTDVKIGSVRFWHDYLEDEELLAHSYEANNFGRTYPNHPPEFINSVGLSSSVPYVRADTLLLHWDFFNVTSSDANGQFIVEDLVSGSAAKCSNYTGVSWLYDLKSKQYPGFADEFYENDTNVVNKEYVFSSRKQNPENLYGNDLVKIVDADDVTFTKDTRPINYYISIEKSMAQVLNDEVMNWFATIDAYNNLLGEPSQRYEKEYSGLAHLRELFFQNVNNRIDFEKFFSFYKWIDSSLSMMIGQLIPASANASDKVRNMVESHMLERSKYENKLPTIEIGAQPKSTPITSHLHYNYVEQAAGANRLESDNVVSRYYTFKPQWLKQRAIRTETPVNTTLEPQNDVDREILRQVINERNIDTLPTVYEVDSSVGYEGRKDLSRIFTKVYKLTPDKLTVVEDVIIPVTVENTPVSSRFIFAEEAEASRTVYSSSAGPSIPATDWESLGGGLSSAVYALASGSDAIYAGGTFNDASGSRISKWDGASWSPLGIGLDGPVLSITSGSNRIYAGGIFSDYVSQWDGASWGPMHVGLNWDVNSLVSSSEGVYAGGKFYDAVSGTHITKWNGTEWQLVGAVDALNDWVNGLVSGSDGLYAAGRFTGGAAKWNGTSWSTLGSGLATPVLTITSGASGVYAGGYFNDASGSYISKWNGTSWAPLAGGLNDYVYSIISRSEGVYAGGEFTGVSGNYVSKWDGTSWSPVADNVIGADVYALLDGSDNLYAGGNFYGSYGNAVTKYSSGSIGTSSIVATSVGIPAYQVFNKRGNYQHAYETVMMSGRLANNKSLEVLEGQYSSAVNILAPSGAVADRTLPVREVNKNVIVERFSAPGGREVNSRGFLDAAAEEYSVYNSLNHRNSVVRKVLNSWMAESASLNEADPSYHKVNKNALKKNTGKTIYDNGFVVHQIPQSDAQYAWITASLANTISSSAFFSEWDNISASYEFLSGNVSGSTVIDFVGLNTVHVKTVDTESNTISLSGTVSDLNSALLNTNGPYQWPSWKQIRNVENPIVGISRKNNNILVQDKPRSRTRIVNKNGTLNKETYYPRSMETFTAYREPPVEYNKPMEHVVDMSGSPQPLDITSTYDNNKNTFANDDLVRRTGAGIKQDVQSHDILVSMEKDETYTPKTSIVEVKHSSQVYPSNERIGLKEIRTRPNYEDTDSTETVTSTRTFWRDTATNRSRAAVTMDIYDYTGSTYDAVGENHLLYPYNNVFDSFFALSAENTRESLFAQDKKKTSNGQDYVLMDPPLSGKQIYGYVLYSSGSLTEEGFSFFGANGGGTTIRAAASGSDGLYVAGAFTTINGEVVNNIAKWDGSTLSAFGNFNAPINCIEIASGVIYAGGEFTQVDANADCRRIAKYESGSWSGLVEGLDNDVSALKFIGTDLYVGGAFITDTFSGTLLNYIARWNGTTWNPLLGGTDAPVKAIDGFVNNIYIGGQFNTVDGTGSNYIANWNGTSWVNFSPGGNLFVSTIKAVASNEIYIGGEFTTIAGTGSNRVAKWDGANWAPLASGLSNYVNAIHSASDGLYVGGYFSSAGAIQSNGVAKWNGSSWSSLKELYGNFVDQVSTITNINGNVFVGGQMYSILAKTVQNLSNKGDVSSLCEQQQYYYSKNNIYYELGSVATYDVNENNIFNISRTNVINDSSVLSETDSVYKILSGSDGVYICGDFVTIGTGTFNRVAKWSGNGWQTLAGGADGQTYDIVSASDGLYAGGWFLNMDGTSSAFISKWNGSNWAQPGAGLDGIVRVLVSGSEEIYAGGTFSDFLQKWDGASWSIVGDGVNGPIYAMSSGSDGLYIGGSFTQVSGGTVPATRIARWDGSAWSALAGGANNEVSALFSGSDGLYAGGFFTSVDGTGSGYIAKWDGGAWSLLGDGVTSYVKTLFSNSSGLYAGGFFGTAGGVQVNGIAKWNGSEWSYLGRTPTRSGFGISSDREIKSITGNDEELFIGGKFIGTRSGLLIKDKNYNNYIEGYYAPTILMPTPQLTINNFIPPYQSTSSTKFIKTNYDENGTLTNIENYVGDHTAYIINDGYEYETDAVSGKKPFYGSYDDFAADLKSISQKYSFIPEYRISNLVKDYVLEKNGNFDSPLHSDYLTLDGRTVDDTFTNINDADNTTSELKTDFVFSGIEASDKINISLSITALKKLLPYRGFYPSERIVGLAGDFINSFLDLKTTLTSVLDSNLIFSSSLSNGTPINQQILTLLQPMMAPGILMNTVKSSIAVDWPLFITSSVSYDSPIPPSFYANTGSELVTDTVYNAVTQQYEPYSASHFINNDFNYRLPFEGLIEFESAIPKELIADQNNLYYLNPSHYTSDVARPDEGHLFVYPSYNMGTGSLKPFGFKDNNYKLAMHNFLAEIPNFFLNGKLTTIVSAPQNQFKAAVSGTTYYMDVVLERDPDFKEFIADPYYEGLKLLSTEQALGTVMLPSPDSLYGPPTRYWLSSSANILASKGLYNYYFRLLDTPAYAPYVPPYYYGKSIARIRFTAEDSRNYSLSEIQAKCNITYINSEADELFAKRSNYLTGDFSSSAGNNYYSSPAHKNMMKISSSVNLFLSAEQKLTKQDVKTARTTEVSDREVSNPSWVIQTKFETPSINFANAKLSGNLGLEKVLGVESESMINAVYSHKFKGLWTTYGQPVQSGEGIKLSIRESFESRRNTGFGSLIDLCGFTTTEQKKTIGLLAESKTVSEGVVIIPYTLNRNHGRVINQAYAETLPELIGENGVYASAGRGAGPFYYKLDRAVISTLLGGLNLDAATFDQVKAAAEASEFQNNSIVKMIKSMTKYVIPPHLDWIRNKNIDPFAMYVVDFTTTFDKEDLSDIWQGVMPKQSKTIEKEDLSIRHEFALDEMFHARQPFNDTKFKVFKVKQRANINYYKLTEDSRDDNRFKFTFGNSQQATVPDYSYNWPYDYFSTVELVNIEATLEKSGSK